MLSSFSLIEMDIVFVLVNPIIKYLREMKWLKIIYVKNEQNKLTQRKCKQFESFPFRLIFNN